MLSANEGRKHNARCDVGHAYNLHLAHKAQLKTTHVNLMLSLEQSFVQTVTNRVYCESKVQKVMFTFSVCEEKDLWALENMSNALHHNISFLINILYVVYLQQYLPSCSLLFSLCLCSIQVIIHLMGSNMWWTRHPGHRSVPCEGGCIAADLSECQCQRHAHLHSSP